MPGRVCQPPLQGRATLDSAQIALAAALKRALRRRAGVMRKRSASPVRRSLRVAARHNNDVGASGASTDVPSDVVCTHDTFRAPVVPHAEHQPDPQGPGHLADGVADVASTCASPARHPHTPPSSSCSSGGAVARWAASFKPERAIKTELPPRATSHVRRQ